MREGVLGRIQTKATRRSHEDVWEHRLYAYRIAKSIVLDRDAAEDAAQAALIRVSRKSSLQDVRAYVRQAVVRECLSQRRKPRPIPLQEGLACPESLADSRLHVQASLAKLDAEQRTVLALSIGEGLSYREIAEILGIPEGTVGSRIHRAKAAFRAAYGEEE